MGRRVNGPKELVAIKRVDKLRVLRVKDEGPRGKDGKTNVRMSSTVWTERNVWGMIESPFLVQLIHAFQDERYLYFVMPLFAAGDLSLYLKHHGVMNEQVLRFYIAEIVLALECLHSCNIVYRDLKPHNILMRPDGHVCLTDFGLCKINPPKGNGINDLRGRIGTKGYQAPEILRGLGHSFPVDFFALGVTIFRLATDSRLFPKNKTTFPYPIPVPTKHTITMPILDPNLARVGFVGDEGQHWHNIQTGYRGSSSSTSVTASRDSQRDILIKQQQKVGGKEFTIEMSPVLADLIQQFVDVDPAFRLGTKNRSLRPQNTVAASSIAPPTATPRSVSGPKSPVQNASNDDSMAEACSQFAGSEVSASNGSVNVRPRVTSAAQSSRSTPASARQPRPNSPPTPRADANNEEYEDDSGGNGSGGNGDAQGNSSPQLSARPRNKTQGNLRPRPKAPSVSSTRSKNGRMMLFKGRDEHGNWNSLHNGFQQIKHHPFFDGFDWDAVAELSIPPPFIPIINISAVNQTFKVDPNEKPVHRKLSDDEQHLFAGFELNHLIRKETDGSQTSHDMSGVSGAPTPRGKRRY